MARAPASASISAEMSPVLAPDTLGWQSCAPTAIVFEPRALSAKPAIRVAGGQTRRSALAARSEAPANMASNSTNEDFRPFIFQLPAISGRIASLISQFPLAGFGQACAIRAQRPLPDAAHGTLPDAAPARLRPLRQMASLPRLRGGRRHFMMLYQSGDALLRNSIRISLGATRPLLQNKLDPCFEECGKPHQTGSARPLWPS